MKNYLLYLALLGVFALSACATTDAPAWKNLDLSNCSVSLRRSGCFGPCPIYEMTVSGDGKVVFDGKDFVEFPGKRAYSIPQDSLRALIYQIDTSGWFNLNDNYQDFSVSDAPSAYVTVIIGKRNKTINHYHGDLSAPALLKIIERRIDEIGQAGKYIGHGVMPKQPQD